MVNELVIASIYFAAGFGVGIATLLIGVALGRITRGEDPGELRYMLPGAHRSDKYPEDTEVYDDAFFERATRSPEDGGLEFPTDNELEEINRHSSG